MIKLLLDTDIGDDIDDALALGLILQSEEFDLIGVTTVFKDTRARARMAKHMLNKTGFHTIPVMAGCSRPFNSDCDYNEGFTQYDPDMDSAVYDEDTHAVDFIIDSVKKYGKELVIAAIGPLTNLATAILKEPNIMSGAGPIVIMGGCFNKHSLEWNVICDPEAAGVVLSSGLDIKMVGLDVTMQCELTQKDIDFMSRSDTVLGTMLYGFIRMWRDANKQRMPILHDPLAIWSLLDRNNFLQFSKGDIHVELNGKFTRGLTFRNQDDKNIKNINESHIQVAETINIRGFIDEFLKRVFKEDEKLAMIS